MAYKKYIIVEDIKTGKKYLDYSDTMIRNFEKVIAKSNDKNKLLTLHQNVKDLTK